MQRAKESRKRAAPQSPPTSQVKKPKTEQAAPGPQAVAAPLVTFRLDNDMKVHYAAREDCGHCAYVSMEATKFALWKGAGKRWESDKHTDLTTGQNYRAQDVPRGVRTVDRSRAAYTGHARPFDGAPYTTTLTLKKAGGKPNRVIQPIRYAGPYERDHGPSGAALRKADSRAAVAAGWTTSISREIHRKHSTTWGYRNNLTDVGANGRPMKRSEYDARYRAAAIYRDTFELLEGTKGWDFSKVDRAGGGSQSVPALDLTVPGNRLSQIGAARLAVRKNAQIHATNPRRGADLSAPGQEYTRHSASTKKGRDAGTYRYSTVPGTTQGALFATRLMNLLVAEGHAEPVPGGGPRTSPAPAATSRQPRRQ